MSTYIDSARSALLRAADGDGSVASWDDDERLLDLYTLLVLTKGPNVSAADVHDAWAIARQRVKPDHADLVPFEELAPDKRPLDNPWRDAIARAGITRHVGGVA